MKHYKSEDFSQILECQAPLHKRKASLLCIIIQNMTSVTAQSHAWMMGVMVSW